jgi:hypothetical protein
MVEKKYYIVSIKNGKLYLNNKLTFKGRTLQTDYFVNKIMRELQ